ncbi:unnamed protein product [Cuscuta campestris]|uniref:Uncharacterized protein n=1 Tax=Cuscuta campestris TaxID=132261 RepID=A0A484LBM1_9ASTE|nr:unnamed protein product [Cuscuta campestris]
MAGRGRPKKQTTIENSASKSVTPSGSQTKKPQAHPRVGLQKQKPNGEKGEDSEKDNLVIGDQESEGDDKAEEKDKEENLDQILEDITQPKTYAEAVGRSEDSEGKLTFVKAEEADGNKYARINDEDVLQTENYWEDTAIGNMWFGLDLKKKEMKQYRGSTTILTISRFMLEAGSLDMKNLMDIPIWIQLPGLESKYWTALSKIGSLIGKLIKADKATTSRTKLDYARLQIAVSANQQFPEKIMFVDENNRLINLSVKYEWKPIICTKCSRLGHEEDMCRKKEMKGNQKLVWKPKITKEKYEQEKEEPDVQKQNRGLDTEKNQEGIENQNEGFIPVSKKKAARRVQKWEEEQYIHHGICLNRDLVEAPYKGHYPFLQ